MPFPIARPRQSRDAGGGTGLLHDRFVGPRRHGSRCGRAATHGHGVPPLPRRRLPDPASVASAGDDRRMGHAAVVRLFGGRPDFRRSPQGARIPQTEHPASDIDDREPSAEGCRCRLLDRSGTPRAARTQAARRRLDRDVLVRRCLGQPFHRAGGVQHRAMDRLSVGPPADPVRVRGQRHRHLDQDAARLDRGQLLRATGHPLFRMQRPGHVRNNACRNRGRGLCAAPSQTGLSAHRHDPALRPCRRRRADDLPSARGDRGRRGG